MTYQLDLILLPLIGYANQDQQSLPGLHITNPSRRSARGRNQDRLILYLFQTGNAPLSDEQISQILTRLGQTFFKTPGSVTAALRAVADALNQYLLDRNLRNTSSGQQSIGILNQVVLRGNRVWMAQSGPTHALVVASSNTQHIFDPSLAGRGLGLSRTAPVRFFQADLNINDALILTPHPPPGWTTATLQNAFSQGPGYLRRYLLTHATPNLNAVLIQAQKGNHEIHLLRPVRAQRPRPVSSIETEKLPEKRPHEPSEETITEGEPTAQELPTKDIRSVPRERTPQQSRATAPSQPLHTLVQPTDTHVQQTSAVDSIPTTHKKTRRLTIPRPNLGPFYTVLAVVWRAFTSTAGQIAAAIGTLFKHMLPDSGIFTLPSSTMAFIAIAIPLVVVTIASLVYFQRGRATQHEIYLAQARQAAQRAQSLEDPQDLRLTWDLALRYIDQAEYYQRTQQSEDLRSQAQGALDSMNYVERLDFRTALTSPLNGDAQITRMVTEEDDLYMLNTAEGVVLRATITNNGYALDPTFQCGPGPFGGYIVGAIVDIAPLPRNNSNRATVLGIDANGNLLYCIPGEAPLALPMAPPDTNWGSPKGIVQDSGDLYILDPLTNAVWIYRGLDVTRQPRLFFSEQIPTMHDVIDLSVNRNDLYLLHEDGQMTTCAYSGLVESPTRCEDPAIYSDPRPGLKDGVTIQDATFSEIQFAPPPDPSIYLLETDTRAIYHLSVRLTLQRLFQSKEPLPEGQATSFAVDRATRSIFLALGNRIFYAILP